MNRSYAFMLAVLLTLSGCGSSCVTGPVATTGLTAQQQAALKLDAPWTKHAKTCRIGGYVVMAPEDGASGEMVVMRDGTTVDIEGLGEIHVRSRDGSIVSVQDLGDTGRFDWISYSTIDPADGQKYNVTDSNADGRLDLKIGSNSGFVDINGEWSQLEKHGDQLGAVVAGEWRPLEKEGQVFRLKAHKLDR